MYLAAHNARPHAPHAPRGVGVVPIIWALGAGAAATVAGTTYWGSSDCNEWWCWQNIKRSTGEAVLGVPTVQDTPDLTLPPIAPETEAEMTMPGAFTPEEVAARTQQRQRDVRTTAGRLGPLATAGPLPTGTVSEDEQVMNLAGIVMLGVGVLLLAKG